MGKKKKVVIPEEVFHLPPHASANDRQVSIIDTHTHLLSTFATYQKAYPEGYKTYHEFVQGFYRSASSSGVSGGQHVDALIDVWCEAPVDPRWKEVADSALDPTLWNGVDYWFVMGVHPHEARLYTDEVEQEILRAMLHPRCIGWGEIGLDYHYMNSPAEIQKHVLRRQLKQAVSLGKPVTIHTREADEDIGTILIEELPKDHKVHVHCFTDSPELARRLLDHFPNLCIGITGVITYGTNLTTSQAIRDMVQGTPAPFETSRLRILLETDAPYMVPANIYDSLALSSGKSSRLAFSHSGMIPWTAEFVAGIVMEARVEGNVVDANDVLEVSRNNARLVYGI